MIKKVTLISTIFILVVSSGYAVDYQIIDLGSLGENDSSALAINNNGQIVGYSYIASNSIYHATLFDSTGAGNNIDLTPLSTHESFAFSINNNGEIVGRSYNASGYSAATLFDSTGSGNSKAIATYMSQAFAINDTGVIVGTNGSYPNAAIFEPNRAIPILDVIWLSGSEGWASSINNSGVFVGVVGGSSARKAVLFNPTRYLGDLQHAYSIATSVNDHGTVVGYASSGWSGDMNAVIFDATGAGQNVYLGSLPGWSQSLAKAINNNNQIVGYVYQGGPKRAILFDSSGEGNNIDLNTLLPSGSGWTLYTAFDINDNGWIVGDGMSPAHKYHAFLLKPVTGCSPADLTNDCRVNLEDFALLAQWWLDNCNVPNNGCNNSDINHDGQVNINDIYELALDWLEGM